MKKRFFALIVSICMLICMLPVSAAASDHVHDASCGHSDVSASTYAGDSGDQTGQNQAPAPEQSQTQNQAPAPEQSQTQNQEQAPEQSQTQNQEQAPEQNQEQAPEQDQSQDQEQAPEQNQEQAPEQDQSQDQEQTPEQDQEQAPEQDQEQAPEQDQEQAPEQDQEQAPEQDQEQAPEQDQEQAPEQDQKRALKQAQVHEHEWSAWYSDGNGTHTRTCVSDASHTETAACSGGTATCSAQAVCEGCGESYGNVDPNNHSWGNWQEIDASTHYRSCNASACRASETAPHSGGDGSCRSACGGCGRIYTNVNGQHNNMGPWLHWNSTQHCSQCGDCSEYFEYGDHIGGTATCSAQAVCEVCRGSYGDVDPDNHAWGEWYDKSDDTHARTCKNNCGSYEYGYHTGGTATCKVRAVCEGCGETYGDVDPNNHTGGKATCKVRAICEGCGETYGDVDPNNHTGGTATCKERAVCEGCGETYGDVDPNNHTGGTATCKERAICEGCGETYGDVDPNNHTWGSWAWSSASMHFRACLDCPWWDAEAPHYGGDGSCRPTCEDCNYQYYDETSTKHNTMTEWFVWDSEQHYRWCLSCDNYMEYDSHSGGTATCKAQAVCEDCDGSYGELDPDNHVWGEWKWNNDDTHARTCKNNCGARQELPHSIGDGSCKVTCEDCNGLYFNTNPTKHLDMSEWKPLDPERHHRICYACSRSENSPHTGGTATCGSYAECEVCGESYGELDSDTHVWSEWISNGDGTHTRVCANDPTHTETNAHTGGTATCKERAVCEGCGESYGELDHNNHAMTDWTLTDQEKHHRWCTACNDASAHEYENHYGGTATCSAKAVCEGCRGSYGNFAPNNHAWGAWDSNGDGTHTRVCANDPTHVETEAHTGGTATCRVKAVCEDCGGLYGEVDPNAHDWGEWVSNGDGTHTRTCANDANHTETEDCTGGTATCKAKAICEVCDNSYGKLDPNNHDWGSWEGLSDSMHVRVCLACYQAEEEAPHYGGDGSCRPTCEGCGKKYYDKTSTKHNTMSEWISFDSKQHYRWCTNCGSNYKEYGSHSGGTATCIGQAVCEVCRGSYGNFAPNNHAWGEWYWNNDDTHARTCKNKCGDSQERSHSGGTATCTEQAVCMGCGQPYGEVLGHAWGAWDSNGDGTHTRVCTNDPTHTETKDCSGGVATCTDKAVCEGCGESYGDVDHNNHNWDSWGWLSDSMHIRACLACYFDEEAPHYGGDGSCMPTCEDCKYQYYDETSTKHNTMSEWHYFDLAQHYRWCTNCGGYYYTEYGSHYGGDGSCQPVCEVCDEQYLDVNGQHNNMSDWAPHTENQHYRYCYDCGSTESNEYENHYGGTATCIAQAVCEGCGESYGDVDPNTHTMSDWTVADAEKHVRWCKDCGDISTYEYENHSGGDGSCTPNCDKCGFSYYDPNGQHGAMSDWYYLSNDQHVRYCKVCRDESTYEYGYHSGDGSCRPTCEVCDISYNDPNGNHGPMSDWYYINNDQHYRYCQHCGAEEYENHFGGDGSCTPNCEVCNIRYKDPNGQHSNMSEWYFVSNAQHLRYCKDCGGSYEYGYHFGGDGSCRPNCDGCGESYINQNGQHSNMSDWTVADAEKHVRWCKDCGDSSTYEYGYHFGGDGSCRPNCDGCGEIYINQNGQHSNMSEWESIGDIEHYRYCLDCDAEEYENHDGGDGSCTPICGKCGQNYINLNGQHSNMSEWSYLDDTLHGRKCKDCSLPERAAHTGGTATCTEKAVCTDCDQPYGELDPDTHVWGEWMSNGDGTHTRVCANDPTHTETKDCSGGVATCTDKAVCEGCGESYGEVLDHTWGSWEWFSFEVHTRECIACHSEEEAPHSGRDGSCSPKCADCGDFYIDAEGQHRNMTDWSPYNDTQHYRYCSDCAYESTKEYGEHTGGTATCTDKAVCQICDAAYGELDSDTHVWGEWMSNGDGTHTRVCANDPTHTETKDCSGGVATCTDKAVCQTCAEPYGEVLGHAYGDWISNGDGTHTRTCANDPTHTETGNCAGGVANCTDKAVCQTCTAPYGEVLGHAYGDWISNGDGTHTRTCANDPTHTETETCTGGVATCTDKAVCQTCTAPYGEVLGHAYGDWMSNGDGTHTRTCANDPTHTETKDCSGGVATCTDKAVCQTCAEPYGEVLGHAYGDWISNGDGTHTRTCANDPTHTETEACTGGVATCTDKAVCQTCTAPYGEVLGHAYGDWISNGDGKHTRTCANDPTHTETEACTGGVATCTDKAVCQTCTAPYGEVLGHAYGDWISNGDGTHTRTCANDPTHTETGTCTGGTATCTDKAVCQTCTAPYGEVLGHAYGDWISNGDGKHTRVCANDPTHTETEACTGGTATCTDKAVCQTCTAPYGELDPDTHVWGEWKSNGDGKHTRTCANDQTHTETEACTGGVATCTDKAVCQTCTAPYGELDPDTHVWGEWKSNGDGKHTRTCANDQTHTETGTCTGGVATCTDKAVCQTCTAPYGELDPDTHVWGEWMSNGDGKHTRVCANDPTHTETKDCSGGVATCTDKAVCQTCGAAYGDTVDHIPGAEADCTHDQICVRKGCGEVLKQKLGHAYNVVVIRPTCTEPGYTSYTCLRCGYNHVADYTAPYGHWYDLWSSYTDDDGNHWVECKRYGCNYLVNIGCTLFEVTVQDGERDVILTVCPICGDYEETHFAVILEAAVKAVDEDALPSGELIVRGMDAPFEGVLYAFTAVYELDGKVVPFKGNVSITLTLDAEKYTEFKLVRVDVTPATETTERTETWTEIDFTYEDGKLSFETDKQGLFLLIPVQ